MSLAATLRRRSSGNFNALRNWLRHLPAYLRYHFQMLRLGLDESYIREAYSYLCCLDVDWCEAGSVYLLASGSLVHIVKFRSDFAYDPNLEAPDKINHLHKEFECVITQNWLGQVFAQVWKPEIRKIKMEYGAVHETHWHEVFRTGRHVTDASFVKYLKELYGERKREWKSQWDFEQRGPTLPEALSK